MTFRRLALRLCLLPGEYDLCCLKRPHVYLDSCSDGFVAISVTEKFHAVRATESLWLHMGMAESQCLELSVKSASAD